jgi:hypothetical protein
LLPWARAPATSDSPRSLISRSRAAHGPGGYTAPGAVDGLAARWIELAARVRDTGGTLTKEPTDAEFFDGRDAYFADAEGSYWEIACAPADNPVSVAARRAAGLTQQR